MEELEPIHVLMNMAALGPEQRRIREVRKYHTLPAGKEENVPGYATSSPPSSPNNILNSFMQLLTCNLGMQRAMVSVVEQNSQYFLAEVINEDISQFEGSSSLWMGCGSTPRSQALCAQTIELPLIPGEYTCFTVPDLSNDQRFCDLPYVVGAPHFRFYAGTPLITHHGVPIGSVFVIDSRPRLDPLSKSEIDMLGITARNVMDYLEMRRGSDLRIKSERMSEALAALITGKSTIIPQESLDIKAIHNIKREGGIRGSTQSDRSSPLEIESRALGADARRLRIGNHFLFELPYSNESSGSEAILLQNSTEKNQQDIPTQESIFSNASELLREALEVDFTVLLEMNFASSTAYDGHSKAEKDEHNSVKVLSLATKKIFPSNSDNVEDTLPFKLPAYSRLRKLTKRYPDGKLWTFDETWAGNSLEDELSHTTPSFKQFPELQEALSLKSWFPGAKQVIFAPVWDVERSAHIAAFFAVSSGDIPVLTAKADLAFVRAFLNNVSIVCSRASMATANIHKGDFISSISHELRSPLHGILASAELLTESDLGRSQRELCTTIATCGQSLLDVITHILEYTKINTVKQRTFPNKQTNVKQSNKLNQLPLLESSSPPIMIDIAKITEEAVRIITAANAYHKSAPQLYHGIFNPPVSISNGSRNKYELFQTIPVIVDITPGDWSFVGHSAAIQRVIMNLVGNSLKYTCDGFVRVDLSFHAMQDHLQDLGADTTIVQIVVTDTGRGISKDFIDAKLFSPFSQESILSEGTGLGLNIVKSLVELQQGTIIVNSEPGKGTTFTVGLPFRRTQSMTDSGSKVPVDEHILALSTKYRHMRYRFQGFRNLTSKKIQESLDRYLDTWFGMENATDNQNASVMIVDEEGLLECSSWIRTSGSEQSLVVVCDQSREQYLLQSQPEIGALLVIPFGPSKLAKALLSSLEPPDLSTKASSSKNSNSIDSFSEKLGAQPTNGSHGNLEGQMSRLDLISNHCHLSSMPSIEYSMFDTLSSSPRILCVDDNAINIQLLKRYMEKLRFQDIFFAENGAIAFETVRRKEQPFDLILMDLSMPICDGFQSTHLIRSLEKLQLKVPGSKCVKPALIVALTGLASQRDQDAAKAAGVDYYLTKPLGFSKLKKLMGEWGIVR